MGTKSCYGYASVVSDIMRGSAGEVKDMKGIYERKCRVRYVANTEICKSQYSRTKTSSQ